MCEDLFSYIFFYQVIRNDSGTDTEVQISGDTTQQRKAEDLITQLLENSNTNLNSSTPSYVSTLNSSEDPACVDWSTVIKDSVTLIIVFIISCSKET